MKERLSFPVHFYSCFVMCSFFIFTFFLPLNILLFSVEMNDRATISMHAAAETVLADLANRTQMQCERNVPAAEVEGIEAVQQPNVNQVPDRNVSFFLFNSVYKSAGAILLMELYKVT